MSKIAGAKKVSVEEIRWVLNNWDNKSISQMLQELSALYGKDYPRERLMSIGRKLCKMGKVSPKKRESNYEKVFNEKKLNNYEQAVILEEKSKELLVEGPVKAPTFYGKIFR